MAFRATVFQLAKAGNIEALQEIVQETRTETVSVFDSIIIILVRLIINIKL